ncbi:hypothetical protein Ocin01_10539, partial [Orchesella cincta]
HKRKNAGKRWCWGRSRRSAYKWARRRIQLYDYENSYEFSNREKGSRIVGYAEIINATILIACAFTCMEWPSFCQLPSLRFKLEILIILVRAVLTTSCGVVLIAAANKRSLAHCRVYMLINTFLVTFHYAYVIVAMIIDEVYVFIWPTIEVFPTIYFSGL